MLTPGEIKFLSKISGDKTAKIIPHDPRLEKIAQEVIQKIRSVYSDLEIKHIGAAALKISGQGDIDIYCLARPQDFYLYLPKLVEIFGQPKSSKPDSIAWELERDNHSIELYLTDPLSEPMKRQIAVFDKLRLNPELLKEYESLKSSLNGRPFKEYQLKKYEFYHKILDD